MMKDMKWKQIDTTYAGKAIQMEAEDIRLHGDVDITGSLTVNGSPLDTPTAAGTSYDNTASGLTADDVQDAIDELLGKDIKIKDFTSLADMCTFLLDSTIKPIMAYSDYHLTWLINNSTANIELHTMTIQSNNIRFICMQNNGSTTSGYRIDGGGAATSVGTSFDSINYRLLYI